MASTTPARCTSIRARPAAELFKLGGSKYFNYCGTALSSLGDVNHDGHDDFIVGSFGEDTGGAAVVHLRHRLQLDLQDGRDGPLWRLRHGGGRGGDLNADGVPDFVIGAPASDSGFELGRA
jgi:hypothetical protein